MKSPRLYATALRRYNRSKGFGIHSPFAYAFVTRTLGERAPYYAYEQISLAHDLAAKLAAQRGGAHPRVMSEKNARMLFRVVCRFAPPTLLQIGAHYGLSTVAALLVDSRSTLTLCAPANPYAEIFDAVTGAAGVDARITRVPSLPRALDSYFDSLAPDSTAFMMASAIEPGETEATVTRLAEEMESRPMVVAVRNLSRKAGGCTQLWKMLKARLHAGMSFTNGNIGFITALPGLPVQHFTLWF